MGVSSTFLLPQRSIASTPRTFKRATPQPLDNKGKPVIAIAQSCFMSYSITETSQPRLKVGVTATSISSNSRDSASPVPKGLQVYVGGKSRGLILEGSYSPAFVLKVLTYFTGKISLAQISERSGAAISLLKSISTQLSKSGLIDLAEPRLILSHRFEDKGDSAILDGSMIAINERLLPELEIATWRVGVRDNGISIMQNRTQFPILIFGKSRIAINLGAALMASGFQSIYYSEHEKRSETESAFSALDLSGNYLRNSDIGVEKSVAINEMATHCALFPKSRKGASGKNRVRIFTPKLIISIGFPKADYLQRWMSEPVPFLIIDELSCGKFSVGPMVRSGQTPCLRCIELTQRDRDFKNYEVLQSRKLLPQREVPAAVATFIAGLVALDTAQFADCGTSDFLGTITEFQVDRISQPNRSRWGFHNECGCHWN